MIGSPFALVQRLTAAIFSPLPPFPVLLFLFKIGTPAYPSPTHDPTHQLPLTKSEFAKILSSTQPNRSGFFWELFKPINNSMQATPTDVAQGVCKVVTPDSPRCKGTIPTINSTMI